MEDMTQYLVNLGKKIAQEHHQTGASMSSLIVKTASAESLNADTRNELIGWSNKSYIDLFGSYEFENATPEEVTRLCYSDPSKVMTKVAYHYPEIYADKGGHTTQTAIGREETKIDHAPDFRQLLNEDITTLHTKYAKLSCSMEPVFEEIQHNIDVLKTLGVSASEIRSEADYPFITEMYNKSPKVKTAFARQENYAINKYIEAISSNADKLTKLASECKTTAKALKSKQEKLAKVKKLGKIYL